MATGTPRPASETNQVLPELQHADFDALQKENNELRELVVQLSKLVIKYVMQPH